MVLKCRKVSELGKAKDLLNEYEVLKQLRHPNIIRCLGYFWEFSSESLVIVLEYANRGDLQSELQARKQAGQHFSDEEVWNVLAQVLLGLSYIHAKGIVHRDIKSLNLFLTDTGMVKLGDFGVSRQMSDKTFFLNSFYGTPLYLSPEIIQGQPYTASTDIWSLGVVAYELVALQPPFHGPSLQDVISNILRASPSPLPRWRSAELTAFVGEMLKREASDRPSSDRLLKTLKRLGKLGPLEVNKVRTPAPQPLSSGEVLEKPPSGKRSESAEGRHSREREHRPPAPAEAAQEVKNKDQDSADQGLKVVRVRKRCSFIGASQVSEIPSADASASSPRGQDSHHIAGPEPGQGLFSTPPGADFGRGAPAAAKPKSLRDMRWEERNKAHVFRVTRVNREDLMRAPEESTPSSTPVNSSEAAGSAGNSSGYPKAKSPFARPSSQPPARINPPAPSGGSVGHLFGYPTPPPAYAGNRNAGVQPQARAPSAPPSRQRPEAESAKARDRHAGRGPSRGRYDIIANRWIDA